MSLYTSTYTYVYINTSISINIHLYVYVMACVCAWTCFFGRYEIMGVIWSTLYSVHWSAILHWSTLPIWTWALYVEWENKSLSTHCALIDYVLDPCWDSDESLLNPTSTLYAFLLHCDYQLVNIINFTKCFIKYMYRMWVVPGTVACLGLGRASYGS